jgi:hypothetical protein
MRQNIVANAVTHSYGASLIRSERGSVQAALPAHEISGGIQ